MDKTESGSIPGRQSPDQHGRQAGAAPAGPAGGGPHKGSPMKGAHRFGANGATEEK